MRVIWTILVLVILAGILALWTGWIDLSGRPGSLPTVTVQGGSLPTVEANVGSIDLGTTNTVVDVPKVDVGTTEKVVETPKVTVKKPGE